MEKNRNFHSLKRLWCKCLKIMKLTFILMLVSLLTVNAESFSQATKLNLKLSNRTLTDVFEEIERQSDYYFIFKDGEIDVNKEIDIDIEQASIEDVLNQLLDGTDMGYQFVDRYIVIGKSDSPTNSKQLPTKLTGTILDGDGNPLPGATVVIKGTTTGTITDFDGKYEIDASNGDVLVFSFVGMTSQEITYAGEDELNITLQPDQLQVEEVVVTALGIRREKKALGYSAQDVSSDDLLVAGDANITSALNGKIAGVQIAETAGGAGAKTRIEIRGTSSLSGYDEPLWVVDGVPFDNSNGDEDDREGEDVSIWGGTSRAGGAFDLNPEDIESISVLKGPNAAALYGERGGNGVIMVTTKKGSRKKGLGISYSGNVTVTEAAYFLDMQDVYGQGTGGEYDMNSTSSWGPKMEGQLLESWTGEQVPFTAQNDRIEDFTRTGVEQNHSVAFTGGNDQGAFRASIGKGIVNGIFEDNKVEKLTFDLKTDYDINKWLNVDTKISYFRTEGNERPEVGNYSYLSYFYGMPMSIRNQDLAPGFDIIGGEHVEKLYTTANANFRNPYFLQAYTTNSDHKDRLFGYFAANLTLTSELKARLKYGLDTYRYGRTDGYLFADNVDQTRPNYNTTEQYFKEENYEFLVTYIKNLNDDFSLSANVGGNSMNRYRENLRATSGRLASEGDFFLGNGTNISAEEKFWETEVRSLYGFANVSYKNYLFLDITGRNDWSSTLTASNADFDNSYFYPSVGISGIISDIVEMPTWVSFAKVRASWAQLGKSAQPYQTSQDFTIDTWNYNLQNSEVPNNLVIQNLKPEISTSWEIGLDVRLFNGRLGLDATYYREETENQILNVPLTQSTGFQERVINAGLITNKGFEFLLTTIPVKTNDFTLGLDFNISLNEGVMEELADGVPIYRFGDFNAGTEVVAMPGEKLGVIRGSKYIRDDAGNIIIGEDGLPTFEERQVIGNIQPDLLGSINLSADYKGFYMNALFSGQIGGDIVSVTEQGATASGNTDRTLAMDRIDFFVDGDLADGSPNNTMVSAQEYWGTVSRIDEEFIYDATYLKLKELAVGYTIPKSLLAKIPTQPISSVRLSLVGRNLVYLYKDTPGTVPDAGSYSTSYFAKAFDFAPVPATRTVGFSLNIGF